MRFYLALLVAALCSPALSGQAPAAGPRPWMNTSLDADSRADLMLHAMTLDEKIQMVHGDGWGVLRAGERVAPTHNGGAGFVPGIPRLGLPDINLADSAVGARGAARQSRYATLLPSTIGLAATWDTQAANLYGSVIGRELRAQGYNMSIGGGVDLIREPRNGRNFEYASEDPLLSGLIVGNLARGVQANQIMGDIKHYVLNDQETGRNSLSADLNKRALRETDLLAFQIAIELAKPAGVMCAYNRVNGTYACENDYTLNQVLKQEWGFKGFVLSDWEGTHSTVKAALAGLDMEQPGIEYFGDKLKDAVVAGSVPQARLDDMVHRILRSMFAAGVIDHPPVRTVVDPFRGRDDARHIAEEGIVLLQNRDALLPLDPATKTILVIGAHADVGVLSGGGSAQVDAPGGNAVGHPAGESVWGKAVYFPSAPLRYLREQLPAATITYDDGTDAPRAARAAANAQVVVLFAEQWMSEGRDAETLSLPHQQDALIAAVAAANPNTAVVLETGGPVTMPWAGQVKSILEAWYPGIGGGEAIAGILAGRVNPSGKLPVTFAASDAQLPNPMVPGLTMTAATPGHPAEQVQAKDFPVDYNIQGLDPGYRWFQVKQMQPLFTFGHGLSYTTFAYSNLRFTPETRTATVDLRNTGKRAGVEIAEAYVTLPAAAGEPFHKLAGFTRVSLQPGENRTVEIPLNELSLSIFSVGKNAFERVAGQYKLEVGADSVGPALSVPFSLVGGMTK